MGFLLGAFGKLQAGARYRSIQANLMRVQSKLRRATRQVKQMETLFDRQEKMAKNAVRYETMAMTNMMQSSLQATMLADYQGKDMKAMTQEEQAAYNAKYSEFNMALTSSKTQAEMQASMKNEYIEQYFQQLRDTQLEALKDEEESLQLEKDSLESELQLANDDYKACKEMEKSDAQIFKPTYTGGGQ